MKVKPIPNKSHQVPLETPNKTHHKNAPKKQKNHLMSYLEQNQTMINLLIHTSIM
jgi:hypothetical protein